MFSRGGCEGGNALLLNGSIRLRCREGLRMRPTCSLGVRLDPPLDAGRKKASLSHQGETVANISFVRVLRRVGSDYPFMSVLQVHVFRTWNSGHAVSFTLRTGLASNHRGFDRRGWRQSGGGGYGRRRAVRGTKVRQEQRAACLHHPPGEILCTPRTEGLLTRERCGQCVEECGQCSFLHSQSIT